MPLNKEKLDEIHRIERKLKNKNIAKWPTPDEMTTLAKLREEQKKQRRDTPHLSRHPEAIKSRERRQERKAFLDLIEDSGVIEKTIRNNKEFEL